MTQNLLSIEEIICKRVDERVAEVLPNIIKKVEETFGVMQNKQLYSQKDMAKKQGVSVVTFSKWVKKGCPRVPDPLGGHDKYDYDEVVNWKKNNNCKVVVEEKTATEITQ